MGTGKTKIGSRVKTFLFQVYLKLLLMYHKLILKARLENKRIVFRILLANFLDRYKALPYEFSVDLAFCVADKLLPLEGRAASDFEKENSFFVDYEATRFANDKRIKVAIADHFRLLAFKESLYSNSAKSKEYLSMAKAVISGSTPLDRRQFSRLYKKLKKERKKRDREYRRQLRERRRAEKEKQWPGFSISPDLIKTLIGLASVLSLTAGYVYNRIFLGYFGINIDNFFTINDYLATSLDKLYITAVTITLSLVMGFLYWSPSYIERRAKMSKKRLVLEDLHLYVVSLSLPILMVIALYLDMPIKYYLIYVFLTVVCSKSLFRLSLLFRNKLLAFAIITCLFQFSGLLLATSLTDREYVVKYAKRNGPEYVIEFTKKIKVPNDHLYLICSNSGYYFFYNIRLRKTFILPKESIELLEINGMPKTTLLDRLHELMHPRRCE